MLQLKCMTITLTVYGRYKPQATPVSKGAFALAAGREKRNFRTKAMVYSMRFASTGFWRMGKPVFPWKLGGKR